MKKPAFIDDAFHDECGVFGIWGNPNAVMHTAAGLAALQHRGQESCGIAVSDSARITCVRAPGTVDNFTRLGEISALQGENAIGHVRYSTVGDPGLRNAQPIVMECPQGEIALCHNGQIVNFDEIKQELDSVGVTWQTSSDSELVLQLCRMSRRAEAAQAVVDSVSKLRGAFSMVLLVNGRLIAARDPHGFRPLCAGKLGESIVISSETCAFDAVGARYLREIEPGEVAMIDGQGINTVHRSVSDEKAHCIFEHVYFARPDSYVFGTNVGIVRTRLGKNLAHEAPADADIIVPVPESGMWSALGYQEISELPLRLGLVRNCYTGRTFIQPDPKKRASNIHLKLNAVPGILAGQRIILIDDSIVRGTTMTRIVELVRRAGAREVHVRIASPPPVASCFYGINTPTTSELIASRQSVYAICKTIGADSLHYLSLRGLRRAVGLNGDNYCTACYTGNYRVPPARARNHNGVVDVEVIKGAFS